MAGHDLLIIDRKAFFMLDLAIKKMEVLKLTMLPTFKYSKKQAEFNVAKQQKVCFEILIMKSLYNKA